jgi:hypothetical protein
VAPSRDWVQSDGLPDDTSDAGGSGALASMSWYVSAKSWIRLRVVFALRSLRV